MEGSPEMKQILDGSACGTGRMNAPSRYPPICKNEKSKNKKRELGRERNKKGKNGNQWYHENSTLARF